MNIEAKRKKIASYGIDISAITRKDSIIDTLYTYYNQCEEDADSSETDKADSMKEAIQKAINAELQTRGGANVDQFDLADIDMQNRIASEWDNHIQFPMRNADCCRAGVIIRYPGGSGDERGRYYIRQCKRKFADTGVNKLCGQHTLCAPPVVSYADDGVASSWLVGVVIAKSGLNEPVPDDEVKGSIETIFKRAHDAAKRAELRMSVVDYSGFIDQIKKDKVRFEKRIREMAFITVSDLTHKLDNLTCAAPTIPPGMFASGEDDLCETE